MEYHHIDMNSQPFLNVMLFDQLGQQHSHVTGHALFYIHEI